MTKQRCLVRAVLGMLAIGLLLCSVPLAQAQSDIEKALQSMSGKNGEGYLQPAMDLLGANMNSGYYHSASISRLGFHIEFDIVGMGSLVGDKQKTFNAQTPAGFTPATAKTVTLFGETGTEVANTTLPGTSYRFADGVFKTSFFPFVVPQLTVGNVIGTQAVVRFMPLPKIEEMIPKTTLFAFGLRHSINQWLPLLPLDVAVSGFWSSFTVEGFLDCKGFSVGAQASKDFSVLTVYGGLAYESSTMSAEYESTVLGTTTPVKLDLTGANTVRFTAGVALNLAVFRLFADMNVGSVTAFSAGFGFGG
jgi:hypothetical protein